MIFVIGAYLFLATVIIVFGSMLYLAIQDARHTASL